MAAASDGLRRLAARAETFERTWPAATARVVAADLEATARGDTGGDGRLSHGRNLGDASMTVRAVTGGATVVPSSPRLWGVLQKAGRRPRRTWTKAVVRAMPKVERSADSAVREVVGG